MKVVPTELPEVLIVEPGVHGDSRGFFYESFQALRYAEAGIPGPFVQDNVSRSARGTLRGLHLQHPKGQGKLVQVLRGSVWDVAVDVRRGSPRFGRWVGIELSEAQPRQLWIPPGFAHGFCVLSEVADVLYKQSNYYADETERGIAYDDPDVGIEWPLPGEQLNVSERDSRAPRLAEVADTLPFEFVAS